ncbi:MAG: CBS domain-containing protein, partial [Syntrophobacteraceae bacterium CG07_land_8_20_14_0_80_61_8]
MNRDAEHSCQVVVTDEDIYQAMKEIPGYLDITVGDFREVYQVAFRNALERLREVIP